MATASRTSKPKKSTARKPRKPQKKSQPRSEVKYLIIGVIGILLALSMYIEGSIGFLGRFVSSFMMGVLGFGAYIVPLFVVAAAAYGLFAAGRRGKISISLSIQIAALLWIIMAFLHVFNVPEQGGLGFWTNLQLLYRNGAASNGGILGGLLGNLLRGLLSSVGAYIVLVFAAIVSVLLLTGRSLSQGLSGAWSMARNSLKYDNDEDEYDDYDEDDFDEEDYEELPKAARRLKPLPKRNVRSFLPKSRPDSNVLDISDAVHQQDDKILLFHEELDPAQAKNKVLPFKVPENPTASRNHTLDLDPTLGGPTVKGLTTPDDYEDDFIEDTDEHANGYIAAEEDIDPSLPGNIEVIIGGAKPYEISDMPEDSYPEEIKAVDETPFEELAIAERISSRVPAAAATVRAESGESGFDTSPKYDSYRFPPIELLNKSKSNNPTESRTQILENSRILEETLRSFKVDAKVVEVSVGPTVTRYDLAPGPGVKVATIANLSNDLALSLAAQGIRIEAPIPGKAAVGIEIPNKEPQSVLLRDILEDESFNKFSSNLAFAIGKDIAGNPVVTDVARMPHLLIAGATGAGKSVCINTLITSILYKAHPDQVKLLMVDPKVVELSVYNGIPHLLVPVVTDPKKASDALQWAVGEMEQRYESFAAVGVRDLKGYNHHVNHVAEEEDELHTLPQIVIIIDELADLMMTCKGAVEEAICRLAQKARAAGIHMILATQRPSVDVITGLIKANIPSRLAFAVSSGTDSRTVLDMVGAEKLLGKGDMLFLPVGQSKPTRLQGGFVHEKEVESVVNFLKAQTVTVYPQELVEQVTSSTRSRADDEDLDEFFQEAAEFLIEKGKGSTSMLQRRFRIGYNRASRLMEDLETRGIVGPEDGVKPRKILTTWEEFQANYM